ncbi:uncharacterized protein KY384_007883 [Bacidia gigantensis]|uniref:uncharacterized protein n=1 Tax=Bacidia gigantensis TaxID=2732470 RepID=UPI001D044B78|nr:uncharacterized protein KY384_007883 [Bacidia gigantensis]KAG8527729.1 hypothetical protein KY384_007883 [Bacidia gigantensis]
MSPQGRPVLWTAKLIAVLLDHIDKRKGDIDFYVADKNRVVEELTRVIKDVNQYTGLEITEKQVLSKCTRLASQIEDPVTGSRLDAFFTKGRDAFEDDYLYELNDKLQTEQENELATTKKEEPTTIDLTTEPNEQSPVPFNNGPYERSQAIESYLARSSYSFVEDDDALQKLQSNMLSAIEDAATGVLHTTIYPNGVQTVVSDMNRYPILNEALSVSDFSSLCQIIFGVTAVENISSIIVGNRVTKGQFLRAVIAAFACDRILFQGTSIERDLLQQLRQVNQMSQIKDDLLAKGKWPTFVRQKVLIMSVCRPLFDQIRRESNHILLHDQLQPDIEATRLVKAFTESTAVFLDTNKLRKSDQGEKEWTRGLRAAFAAAIKLKACMLLRDLGEHVTFPTSGNAFNPRQMRTSDHLRGSEGRRVKLAFFPTVRRRDGQIVLYSLVALRPM